MLVCAPGRDYLGGGERDPGVEDLKLVVLGWAFGGKRCCLVLDDVLHEEVLTLKTWGPC